MQKNQWLLYLLFAAGTACSGKHPVNRDTESTSDSVVVSTSSETTDSTSETEPVLYVDNLTGNEISPDIDWIQIPAGSFIFGSAEGEPCSFPSEKQVPVTLTHPFVIAATEITQAQWEALDFTHSSWAIGPDKPVTLINFFEAAAWCNRLSRFEGLDPCYDLDNCTNQVGSGCFDEGGVATRSCGPYEAAFICTGELHRFADRYSCPGYRIPSSAEWEYASRAGISDAHTYGGDVSEEPISSCSEQPSLNEIAWYCNNSGEEVHDVAQKLPNPWGLYDMLGNVEEWTDYYFGGGLTLDYEHPDQAVTDPIGPAFDETMETRGRYFDSTGCLLRFSSRFYNYTDDRRDVTGFRPVRTIFE